MAAERVFLDTNGWIALLSSDDSLHWAATQTWAGLLKRGCSIVLTDWIVAETGNGLARTAARSRFPEAVVLLQSSPRVRFVPLDPPLLRRSLDLYASRNDKQWGLVDCASFVVMQDLGISSALTNDRHFAQAGFSRLLPGPLDR